MSAAAFASQRCYQHSAREAAARCPACRRFFCRECITEHDGKMICGECLRAKRSPQGKSRSLWAVGPLAVLWVLGLGLGFLFFYGMGRILLTMPTSYHDGTIWQQAWKK